MALNYIWIAFFLIAFAVALLQFFFGGDAADSQIFGAMLQSTFDMSKVSVEISLGLIGVMSFWQGIMKVGEHGGAVAGLTKLVSPFFSKLFPGIPKDHPASGAMIMNFSANMLGLDNAATPLGLKAMQEMQKLNDDKDRASDAMIMFIVLNTSGLTIVPVSIMAIRASMGAANPADVFLPIMIATYFASLGGLIAVSLKQRINLFNPIVLLWLGSITAFIAALLYWFSGMPQERVAHISGVAGPTIIICIIMAFLAMATWRKVNVYESFIEGAKEGFKVSINIIPYLVAMLVGIGLFRASGAFDLIITGIAFVFSLFLNDVRFVDALPTALMKPLSGSGARGMMVESINHFGVDSLVGRMSSVLQGSTETTFYTLAVYFGSVGIRKTRYALATGLFADLCGITAAIIVSYLFFG